MFLIDFAGVRPIDFWDSQRVSQGLELPVLGVDFHRELRFVG